MKRSIIKTMLTMCGALFALDASADGLYIDNFNTLPNTATTVSVKMKNTNIISGYQFDLVLPSGVTLNSATTSTSRTSYTYSITQKTQPDGSIRIFCIASGSAAAVFTGTDGEVMKLSLTSTETGDKTLTLKNQVLTESDLDEIEPTTATTTMHVHALTPTAAKAATCTAAGNIEYYKCSTCGKLFTTSEGTTETTLSAVTIAALGHGNTNGYTATYTWGGTYSAPTCKLTLVCKDCNTTVVSAQSLTTETSGTYGYYNQTAHTDATCTAAGSTTYTATGKYNVTGSKAYNETDAHAYSIAALGHSYGTTPTWSWTGTTACTGTLTCTHDASHTLSGNATITSAVKTAATCTAKGTTTYTAKVTLNGNEYTDSRDAEDIPDKGHGQTNGYTATYTWDGTATSPTCKLTLVCKDCNTTVVSAQSLTTSTSGTYGYYTQTAHTDATCTATGSTTYTATGKYNVTGSKAYNGTDAHAYSIAALGHSYGTPVFEWSEDGKTASAKMTCSHDASHTLSGNATITSAVKTAATCTAKGTTTYTAKVTLNGTEYTDSKDVEDIAAKGHAYGDPVWNWEGYTSAKATFTCSSNDDTKVVTATIVNSTDIETAVCTYTATVTFCDRTYTDIKTESFIMGDVNNDKKVNIIDITYLIDYLNGKNPSPFNKSAADLDGNGINVDDVTALRNKILQK